MQTLKKLENSISKSIGRAIKKNALIEDNDRVLVGVSGGKDSLTLLKILSSRRKWMPIKYDIVACHIISNHVCAECHEVDELKKLFNELECEYVFEKSDIADREDYFSCFWCAWNRRKAMFKIAERTGCTKIALGHHMDDAVETTLMNLFFRGEISSINPKQPLFDGKMTIIRPMIYLEEKRIADFAKVARLPESFCRCPNATRSRRFYIKDLLTKLESEFKYVKKNIMNAPHRIKEEYLGVRYG
ncbi:MAG: ATP-binding protein [Candidatus Omnitrophota bacterium]